jgi:hypothetical protein
MLLTLVEDSPGRVLADYIIRVYGPRKGCGAKPPERAQRLRINRIMFEARPAFRAPQAIRGFFRVRPRRGRTRSTLQWLPERQRRRHGASERWWQSPGQCGAACSRGGALGKRQSDRSRPNTAAGAGGWIASFTRTAAGHNTRWIRTTTGSGLRARGYTSGSTRMQMCCISKTEHSGRWAARRAGLRRMPGPCIQQFWKM